MRRFWEEEEIHDRKRISERKGGIWAAGHSYPKGALRSSKGFLKEIMSKKESEKQN